MPPTSAPVLLTSTTPGRRHDGTVYEGYRDPLALMLLRHAADRPGALAPRTTSKRSPTRNSTNGWRHRSGPGSLGVGPGDRVAVRLPNSVGFLSVALGCLWLGVPFVPISIDDPARRVEQILNDSDPRLVVALEATECH